MENDTLKNNEIILDKHIMSIPTLFEKVVRRFPEKVALVMNNKQVTYRELNNKSNQLAHYLKENGVDKETFVGLAMERSIALFIGMLGILKAGGAIVPLDPNYPKERLEFMLKETNLSIVITQKHLEKQLPSNSEKLIFVDNEATSFSEYSYNNPDTTYENESLAYILFTSGSTGKPKGVEIMHQGVSRLIEGIPGITITPEDTFLQLAPFSFGASTFEIWGCLLNGARLIITPQQTPSLSDLSTTINSNKVSILWLPVGLFNLMVDSQLEAFKGLKYLMIGGDFISTSHLKKVLEIESLEVVNGYGLTENSTFTCCYPIPKDWKSTPIVPVGRPLSGVEIHVLDNNHQEVPIGVVGEVFVSGNGLARRYLNRPKLTSEKFIKHPSKPGLRLYNTGDLGRWLSDRNLELRGRVDNMVKIRGFRVELGEVEKILNDHPDVKESVVIARQGDTGEKYLATYVILKEEDALKTLRDYLGSKLPEYMIPSTFTGLDEFPLNPNGKVDRKALPEPDLTNRITKHYSAPSSPIADLVATIWSQTLGIEEIGVTDSFIELGGNSLLGLQIAARLQEEFQLEILPQHIFEYRTVNKLAEFIDQLRRAKQLSSTIPLERVETENHTSSLSYNQEGLWFIDQYAENKSLYNVPFTLHIKGNLQITSLERSLNILINRHEILKNVFKQVDDNLVQTVAAFQNVTLPIFDFSSYTKEERKSKVKELMIDNAETPFNLTQGPLFRIKVAKLDTEEFIILCNVHHIIFDATSLGIFIKECFALYEEFVDGVPALLPKLSVNYTDFVTWQKKWLNNELIEKQLKYWKTKLAGELPVLQLPTDYPRPVVQKHNGALCKVHLSNSLVQELKTLSKEEGSTLFMTLLTAYKILLSKYTGQEDIIVGSPSSIRNHTMLENLIGYLVNTLVFRTNISGSLNFLELLSSLKQTALEAYKHQDTPLDKIINAIQPERSTSYSPLFQTLFVLPNKPVKMPNPSGLNINLQQYDYNISKFDLSLFMEETDNGMLAIFEYDTDLFAHSTIQQMANHFLNLLNQIVKNPNKPIDQLSLLSNYERDQIINKQNKVNESYKSLPIQLLFEEQVKQTPYNIAVKLNDRTLTYKELNEKSNQLAHFLQKQGVNNETLVGIYMDRSIEMIVGLLAVLKSGGAYVPLDPQYPKDRISYMISDSELSILLTQEKYISTLPKEIKAICMDHYQELLAEEPIENVQNTTNLENLAYVIYTSGSTGKPKGVMMKHKTVTNLIQWQCQDSRLELGDKTLQFTTLSFDVAIQEIFSTWCSGGELVLINEELRQDFYELSSFIVKENIARLFLPFVALQQLADVFLSTDLLPINLKEVITAGEQLQITANIKELFKKLKDGALYNQYGPTESHVVTSYKLDKNPEKWPSLPPIGYSLPNSKLFVLDEYQQPIPAGIIGELYIGGDVLAKGYKNKPELTKKRFIASPFSTSKSEILYRTGDLVRYLPNGAIEFIGRADDQVKVRGFRIELGEIESHLSHLPNISEAVVSVYGNTAGEKRLVAYLVANTQISPKEISQTLKDKLPEYMVPKQYVQLESLPLTPSGKIDRRALPQPSMNEFLEDSYIEPKTQLEKQVAKIWCDVLDMHHVGIEDNFFELGGHSLLATKLVFKIRKFFQLEIPLRALFENPTINGMCKSIEKIRKHGVIEINKSISQKDLHEDITLDPDIKVNVPIHKDALNPKSIFLTGATGFLGGYLLSNLLNDTEATIYCLVRATTPDEGLNRIQQHLSEYEIWNDTWKERIIPVVGDLAKPLFGLTLQKFDELGRIIDSIYHCGAVINFVTPYSIAKGPNVLGTQEVLRLASKFKTKPVHYVSTIAVFSPEYCRNGRLIPEDTIPSKSEGLRIGYTQSKWVAENIIKIARERGIPVSIYRPGRISGNSITGACQENDFLWRQIKGYIQLGSAPIDEQAKTDLLPVDFVSRAILHLSLNEKSINQNYHIFNPHPSSYDEIYECICCMGYSLDLVAKEKWIELLQAEAKNSNTNALAPLVHLFSEGALHLGDVKYDNQKTTKQLFELGIKYPSVNTELIKKTLEYFQKTSYLPFPSVMHK